MKRAPPCYKTRYVVICGICCCWVFNIVADVKVIDDTTVTMVLIVMLFKLLQDYHSTQGAGIMPTFLNVPVEDGTNTILAKRLQAEEDRTSATLLLDEVA